MKSKIRILATGALLFLSAIFAQRSVAQQYVSLQVFYDQLNPYGQWVDYPDYGYVWLPDVGPDFMPYGSNGQWIFTDYGWTWVSGYEWGWAPFHYGRWDFDNFYGWFWIPDNEWGPAWVSWRRAEGYYGWEPMGPGISVTISFGREYDRGHDHWIFVRDRDFDRQNVNQYYVDRSENSRIVVNSTIINNTYIDKSRNTTYVTGPDRYAIQKETGRQVNPVTIREDSRPGQKMENGSLHIYRPQVAQNNNREQKPAPSKYTPLKDVKPRGERNNEAKQENNARPAGGNTSNQNDGNQRVQGMTPQNRSSNGSDTGKKDQPGRVAPENHQTRETRASEPNTEKRNSSGGVASANHTKKESVSSETNTLKGNQPERVAPENRPTSESRPSARASENNTVQKSQNEGNIQKKSGIPQKTDQPVKRTRDNKAKSIKPGAGKSGGTEKSK